MNDSKVIYPPGGEVSGVLNVKYNLVFLSFLLKSNFNDTTFVNFFFLLVSEYLLVE